MLQRYGKGLWMLALAVVLTVAFCTVASASDGTTYYVKFGVPFVTLGDEDQFDGLSWFYPTSNENINFRLPYTDRGNGLGITFGGVKGHWGGEFYFFRTSHDGLFLNSDFDLLAMPATYLEYGANIKYYFLDFEQSTFNGYALIGIGRTRVSVENGAINSSTLETANYTLQGPTYNLGLGFTAKFGENMGLECQYIYGWTNFTRVEGLDTEIKPEDEFKVDERKFNISLMYMF